MVRCYDWTQLHTAYSGSFRTSESTPSFESLLMQLNTEATADADHQYAGALPIL